MSVCFWIFLQLCIIYGTIKVDSGLTLNGYLTHPLQLFLSIEIFLLIGQWFATHSQENWVVGLE